MNKFRAILQLIRPINCTLMGFAVFVGVILANPSSFASFFLNIIYGFCTGFFLTGAAMIINDYYDREIDAVNEPSRPLPLGLISTNEALSLFILISLFSISVSCFDRYGILILLDENHFFIPGIQDFFFSVMCY